MKITIEVTPDEDDYKALFKAIADPEVAAAISKLAPTMMSEGAKALADIPPETRAALMETFQDAWNIAAEQAVRNAMGNMLKYNPMLAMMGIKAPDE